MRKLIILLVFVFSLSTLICATAPSDVKIYDMRGLESQQLILGAEYKISCTDSDASGGIEFQYSTDDGGSWNLLTFGTLISTGKYSAVFNIKLEIDKVRAWDTANTATSDEYSVTVSEANSICISDNTDVNKSNLGGVTPDGNWAVCNQEDASGYNQVVLYSLSSQNSIVLTSGNIDHDSPQISPDGNWVCYVESFGIYMKQIDSDGDGVPDTSGNVRQVYFCPDTDFWNYAFTPSWTPDGSEIVFIRGGDTSASASGIVRVSVSDPGSITHIYNADRSSSVTYRGPKVSSDGNKVVFRRTFPKYDKHYICTVSLDGTNYKILTPNLVAGNPSWSPNGERIIFHLKTGTENYDIMTISSDGSDNRIYTVQGVKNVNANYYSSSNKICFISDRAPDLINNIWIMDNPYTIHYPVSQITSPPDLTDKVGIINITGNARSRRSVDGSILSSFSSYQLSYGEGKTPSSWTQLCSNSHYVDDSILSIWDTRIGAHEGIYTLKLVVTDSDSNLSSIDMVTINIAGTRQITFDDTSKSNLGGVTPDGNWAVCNQEDASGYNQVVLYSLSSQNSIVLTSGNIDHDSPQISPDGNWVCYVESHGIRMKQIDSESDNIPDPFGNAQQVYSCPISDFWNYAFTPSWTPDGSEIIFIRGGDTSASASGIVKVSVSNPTSLTHIYNPDRSSSVVYRGPKISPDGTRITFRRSVLNTDKHSICTISTDGLDFKNLTSSLVVDNPSWSADGDRIMFQSKSGVENNDIMSISSDGSDTRLYTIYGGKDIDANYYSGGSNIGFISSRGAEAKDNVWIMDNSSEMYKPIAYIYSPVKDTIITTADVDIIGIASDNISADGSTILADMEYFVLDYEDAANPGVWTPINSSVDNVNGNVLGTWDTGGLYGIYNVRVSAFIGGEVKNTCHLSYDVQTGFITDFTVDNTSISPNSDGNKDSAVFSYTIASDSTITLLIKKKSDDSLVKTLLSEESKTTGVHICEWDGSDLDLETAIDGYYYAEIAAVQSGSESNKKIEIKVDRELPYALITTPGEGESVGRTFEIRGSATDDSFDHFTLRYSADNGSAWTEILTGAEQVQEGLLFTITLPIGITSGTDLIIALRVYDEANPFSEDILNVVTDFDAPALPDQPTTSVDQNSIIVNWSASPESDVIRYVIYRDDTEIGQSTDLSFTEVMYNDGAYEYKISAVDLAGNESILSTGISQIIDVDHSPPESTLAFGVPFHHFLEYTKVSKNTLITVESDDIDIAGLADIYYKWDFEPYHTANHGDVIAIPEGMSGNHSLYYYGIDNYGNQENEKRRILDIDTIPPMTFLVPTGKYTVSGNVYTVGATYDTCNFSSHYSDTSIIHYRITTYSSTEPWNTYSGSPFQIADTTIEHTVEFYAIDDMDNTEETEVVTIVFDSTPPSTTPLIESLSQTADGVAVALKDRSGEENPSFLIHRKISSGTYSEIGETDSAIFNDAGDKDDGSTYFYKAQVADQYGNVLDNFSNEVSILVDMIPPEVTSITLNPSGIIDNEIVSVTVDISEELREDPVFKAEIPSLNDWEKEIPLSFVSENGGTYTWTGTFLLDVGDGTGEFEFSGIDLAGNTGINIGTPVTFEANIHAPYITDIEITGSINGEQYLNEDIFPVSVEFSEEIDSSTIEFYYFYNNLRYDITLSIDPGNPLNYTGEINLNGFTGEGQAEFFFSADDLHSKTGANIGEYNTSTDRFFNIDTVFPAAPALPVAEKKPEGEIKFTWPALDDDSISYYYVNIVRPDNPDIMTSVEDRTFYSGKFLDEESVTFKVRAIDRATNEGAYSAEVVVIADASLPSSPSGFTAVIDNNAVLASWVAVAEDCVGYNIYKKTAEFTLPDNAAKVNDVLITATSYQDSTLDLDAEYFYAVTAVDEAGNESEVSDRASIQWDIYPPTAQISIIPGSPVKAGDLAIALQVSEPLDTSKSYSLSIKTAGMAAVQNLILTPANDEDTVFTASYTVDSTSGDGEAVFEFSGSDLSGKVGDQITSGKTFIIDTTPPGIPQYLYAQPLGNGEIKITWSPPQGELPSEYFLYRSDDPDQAGQKLDVSIINCEYIDVPDLDAIYYYSVSAVDEAGNEGDIAGPAEVGCDSISPTAIIVLSQESPLTVGKLLISLELSEIVKNEPILQMVTYNGDYFMINLQGSEKSWSGSIYLNETTSDGPGYFDFYAVDFSDNIGKEITEGTDFIIETSPPTAFIEGFPLIVGSNLHYGFTLTSNEPLTEVPKINVQYYDREKQEITLQSGNDELTVFNGSVWIPAGASSGPAEFQFEGNDKYGNTGTVITSGKEFSVDSYPPSSPVIILAKAFPNRMVQLRWLCADTDIAEFEILVEGEEFSEIYYMNKKEIYLHTPDDGNYSFSVRAIDYVGNTGEYSSPVTLTTDGTPPYFTISCLPFPIVSPGDYTFSVFSSENLQSMPVIKWKPEYSDKVTVSGISQVSDNEYSFVLSITGNEYDGLSHFEATGYDLVGNIGNEILSGKNHLVEISKPVCWITTNPSSPFGLGSININLKTNENIQGTPTLTAHFDGSGTQDIILTGSGNLWTGVLDTTSVAQGAGYFSFAATDFADKTSDSTSILSGRDFEVDLTDPAAPTLNAEHIQGGKIRLYWTEPAGENLVYRLKRGVTDQLSSAVEIADGIQGDEYFDYVSAAGDYYYWLNAVDDAGNESDYSGSGTYVNIGVFPPIITYPTTYSVNADPFIVNGSPQTIKGTADPGATIELFRGDTSVAAGIGVDANGDWEYTLLAISEGSDFVITAISTLDGVPSEKSLSITLTRDDIPGVPSGLVVVGHDTKISITWDGNPIETDIAGYNIYRDNDPRAINRNLIVHLGSVPHQYYDIGLTNGRTYSYQITAVDSNGNESPHSDEISTQPIASAIWGVE